MRRANPLHIGRLLSRSLALLIICLSLFSCCTNGTNPEEPCKGTAEQYGQLATAVLQLAVARIAIYGNADLPQGLTADAFVETANEGELLPPAFYEELKRFKLVMNVTGSDYVLKVYNPDNGCLIVYDCSCSLTLLDGPVYEDPAKYREDNLPCECH